MSLFIVGIGGYLGAVCRYLVCKRWNIGGFPYGTLLVNVLGSFLLGYIMGVKNIPLYLFLATGFVGSFTTFSTLSWECLQMILRKEWRKATLYLVGNYGLGMLFVLMGYLCSFHKMLC